MNADFVQRNIPPPIPKNQDKNIQNEIKIDSKEKENKGPPPIKAAIRPKSPKDTTQIIVNGKHVDRDTIPPIILPNMISENIKESEENEELENIQVSKEIASEEISSEQIVFKAPEQIIESSISSDTVKSIKQALQDYNLISENETDNTLRKNFTKKEVIDIHTTDVTTPIDILKPTSIMSPQEREIPVIENINVNNTIPKLNKPVPEKRLNSTTRKPTTAVQTNTKTKKPQLSPRTSEQLKRLGYITNYTRLRDSWPEYKFPDLPDESTTDYIINAYEHCISKIQLDMNVNQYKAGLIILFLVIEVISVKYMGLDGGGYTVSQIKAMNRYERLLIELGEKRLISIGNQWSVEVRITFIALVNFGIFVLMKWLSGLLGPELSGMITPLISNLFSGGNNAQNNINDNIPDVPERSSNLTGLVGTFAQMASSALNGNNTNNNQNSTNNSNPPSYRRPTYRQ
jgi:hypothetical protein